MTNEEIVKRCILAWFQAPPEFQEAVKEKHKSLDAYIINTLGAAGRLKAIGETDPVDEDIFIKPPEE